MAAPSTLEKLLAAFAEQGIDAIPVKGIITSHLLYDDIARRPLPDIDLRILSADLARVTRIARARGWEPKREAPILGTVLLKVDGWEVDVETTLGPPGLCALGVGDVLRRAERRTEPFGFPHLQPEFNDHALILVLNAFKDGLRPMPWSLEDLRRIARHASFDADVLVARAREGRVASALWIVADWLCAREGASEWKAVRDLIGDRPPNRRLFAAYAALDRRGWPAKAGLVVTSAGSDSAIRSAAGLGLLTAGVMRRRALLAFKRWYHRER